MRGSILLEILANFARTIARLGLVFNVLFRIGGLLQWLATQLLAHVIDALEQFGRGRPRQFQVTRFAMLAPHAV